MKSEFNLFVSVRRGFEIPASEELKDLLEQLGDTDPDAWTSIAEGLIYGYTNLDPFNMLEQVKDLVWEGEFDYPLILKIRPIERVVGTDLEEIKQTCAELAEEKIDQNETFRVTLERRFTDIPRKEILVVAASNIDREVDLEDPDKIVFVEVLGETTGISVLSPEDEISIVKEREERNFKEFEEKLQNDKE